MNYNGTEYIIGHIIGYICGRAAAQARSSCQAYPVICCCHTGELRSRTEPDRWPGSRSQSW
jgi:hypothetical protein